MSITTPGLVEAGPWKVTAPVSAGFVKNDASGNLLFGQAASAWDFIEFKNTSSGGFGSFATVLDGNTDEVYLVEWQGFGTSSAAGSNGRFTLNLVEIPTLGGTVGGLYHSTSGSSTPGISGVAEWRLWSEGGTAVAMSHFGRAIIYAKSGKFRTGHVWSYSRRGPAALSSNVVLVRGAFRWTNTTTNITRIGFTSTFGGIRRGWLYKIKKTP